jgi:hypothetical protein
LNEEIIKIHPDDGGDSLLYGSKVLGSYIGSDEYILSRLEEKLEELSEEADAITQVHSHQIKYLLLRWCFCQKLIFLQRTHPPRLINTHLASGFTDLKRMVLCSILGRNDLEEKFYELAELHIHDSGIGLFSSSQTSHAAYVASMVESYEEMECWLNTPSPLLSEDLPMIDDMKVSLQQFTDLDADITFTSLLDESKKPVVNGETLQHQLSTVFRASNRERVVGLFQEPREIAWMESLRSPEAGLWLEFAPKTSMHRMTDQQFQVALTLRLFLPQKCIRPNTLCTCRKGPSAIPLDAQGVHLCTGCNQQGTRINSHDRVRDQIVTILSYCGVSTKTEERNCFRAQDPDNEMRADISAFNLPDHGGTVLLDVRLTSPVPANDGPLTRRAAARRFRAGELSFKEKRRTYQALAERSNLGFEAIVFEITGQMHESTRLLLDSCLRQAARIRNAPFKVLWHYWISTLMFTLQRNMADGILQRSADIYGRKFKEFYETSPETIEGFEYLNVGNVRADMMTQDGDNR